MLIVKRSCATGEPFAENRYLNSDVESDTNKDRERNELYRSHLLGCYSTILNSHKPARLSLCQKLED